MEQLKLLALDADDLEIISAHVQDAVMQVGAFDWRPKEKRFLIEMNRFVWEKSGGIFRRHNERRRSILHFDRVLAVRSTGIDRAKRQDVLSLLTVGFAEDDTPAGTIELLFAGGGSVALDVECIEARLTDLGAAWAASSRPAHGN
ncbi:MAG: DUF2948 family protein [Mesorhizobium sp.]|nr:DUF2948 family protein [Mesorhizobium sp.]MCO5163547.1 DUF2948 family protein [Mesorhizobium sp.]